MKICLLIAFCIVALTSCAKVDQRDLILGAFKDGSTKDLFKVYHFVYNKDKEYGINTEAGLNRYKAFKATMKSIKTENARLGKQVYGITPFADLTPKEFQDKYLMKADKNPGFMAGEGLSTDKYKNSGIYSKVLQGEYNIDWREQMNEARNQAHCGSCWAFAAVASIEGNYNIAQGQRIELSEQFLVECSVGDSGCNGGYPDKTFPWIMNNGVKRRAELPYKASVSFCSTKLKKGTENLLNNFESCKNCSEDEYFGLLKQGPGIVSMDASGSNFKDYKPANNEYYDPPEYSCNAENHAITLVGAGMENGQIILIVRNSWGTNWGIQGYFRIPYKNSCLIHKNLWRPITQENKPFTEGRCPEFFSQCDFKGKKVKKCSGFSDFTKLWAGEKLSGFKANFKEHEYGWNAYEEAECVGKDWILGKEDPCTETDYRKRKFKSVGPLRYGLRYRCANFYKNTCFNGDSLELCEDMPDTSQISEYINNVNSFAFDDFFNEGLIVFEQNDYKGLGKWIPSSFRANVSADKELKKILSKAKSIKVIFKR